MADWTDEEIDAATEQYEQLQRRQAAGEGGPTPGGPMSDAEVDNAILRYHTMNRDPVLQQWVQDRLNLFDFEKFRDKPQLADDYLTTTVGPLGTPGMTDALLRADMSTVDPNNPDELTRMFKRHYKQGELKFVPIPADHSSREAGKTVMLARTGPKERWSRFDEPDLSFYDIADMAGALPQIVGEAIGFKGGGLAMRAAGRVAPGLLSQLTGGAIGAGLGEAAMSESLTARGVRDEPVSVSLRRASDAALLSFIAGSVTAGTLQVARVFTGGAGLMPGPVTISPQAQAAMEAERVLSAPGIMERMKSFFTNQPLREPPVPGMSLPALTAAQLTESPVLQRIAGITETLAKRVTQVTREQLTKANELIAMRNKTPAQTAELEQVLDRMGTTVSTWRQRAVDSVSGRGVLSPRVAGVSTQDAINAWREATQARVSALYDRADAISPLMFDLSALAQWRRNLIALQRQGGVPQQLTAQLTRAIEQVDTVLRANPTGQLINRTMPSGEQLRAWRVLDSLRSEAFQATLPNPAEPLRGLVDQRVAGGLMAAVNDVVDNPVLPNLSGTTGEQFTAALTAARDAARRRFDDLDIFHALASAKAYEFNPSAFARGMMKDTADELPIQVHRMLTTAGLGDRWAAIQAGVRGELLHRLQPSGTGLGDPQSVIKWLDQWRDPSTKRLFMSETEELSWRKAAADMIELERIDFARAAAADKPAAEAVLDIVSRGDKAGLHRVLALPASDPLRQSIRAGLLAHLADMQTTLRGKGAVTNMTMPDVNLIKQTIADWRKSGVDRLLAPQDLDFMENVWRYVTTAVGRSDVGTSIAGASLAAELTPGKGFLSASVEWMKHLAIGRALTSPAFRRLLVGFKPGSSSDAVANAALLGQITDDLLEQQIHQPTGSRVRPIGP